MANNVDISNKEECVQELRELVAYNIRRLRLKRGISQRDLAAWCNFEYPNMCRIESGRMNITLQTMARIVSALDVEVTELFRAR
ncbi:MAG: helix-turn-helix transcriptional regulator [Mucinivorans sp.]